MGKAIKFNKAFSFVLQDDILQRLSVQSKSKRISKACYVRNAIINQLKKDELTTKTGETKWVILKM